MSISGVNLGAQPISIEGNNVELKTQFKVKENVDKLNKVLESQNAKYVIKRHEIFGDTMIKIVDKISNEVIFEVPPEKILEMVAKLCEISGIGEMAGLKINKKA